ncbi:MAG: DUF2950 domain-containing protein [Planctomycetes bacterium]|jgi:hypothetical protein|nr:DUF2950 domain-containing protein [Planctomycetota bacterium]
MSPDGNRATNLLLVVVIALILASMAIPVARNEPPPAPPTAPVRDTRDAEIADLVAKVDLLLRSTPALPDAPAADEIVVRVPGQLARDLGLTAGDIRALVEGMARMAKLAGGAAEKEADPKRRSANEVAAIATSRNVCSAHAQFQASARADVDHDGIGEFGTFTELSGAREVRGSDQKLNPPVLSGAFRSPGPEGFVARAGYHFIIYLPDAAGDGIAADAAGTDRVDPELAERHWCLYAWPIAHGETGRLTFMVNQAGDVLATDCAQYTGPSGPRPGAAFVSGGPYSITGTPAIGRTGQDGNEWKQAN